MRLLRFLVVVLFILVSGVYAWFYFYNQANTDLTIPQISFGSDVLEVPVNAAEADLLRDVRAQDEKDGDLSSRVIVEKISNFVAKGLSNITYAAVDNDRHTVKATRRVRYTDYLSPRFTLSQPMRFDVGSSFNILRAIGAVDVIDGDISGKIKLIGSDLIVNTPGVYSMQAQVTNSKGDVSYLRFNVTMTQARRLALNVSLREYLVYLNLGDPFTPEDYLLEVTQAGQPLAEYDLQVTSNMETGRPGMYTVLYSVLDSRGQAGETELAVIVEEN